MASPITISQARENATGVDYLRIAHAGGNVWHPYFHRESWSADDKGFVFHTDGEVWYLDLASREVSPLSQRAGGPIGALHVSRDGHILFFVRGRQVCSMPLTPETGLPGEIEVLHETDPTLAPIEISPNADDSGLAIMVEVRNLFRRVCYLDLARRERRTCFEGHRRLGHLQMNPARQDLIMFADQHDPENFQRMYTVLTSGREHFPFYRQRPGEWVTHECFSRDGNWVTFTVAQPVKGLHAVRSDGSEARQVAAGIYWHACPSADASVIAADLYDGEVRLVQRDTGEFKTVTPRWMPKGKMIPQGPLHAHPCLSRTGRWLLHVDGSGGKGVLRLIDLAKV
ncbi:MAG: hypothetical protein JXQ73_06510 [Phycisphaerae bacterium]|nr:hypothetical protein [Phycisphaerae bacterium]